MATAIKPIKDHVLDWMYEDECQINQRYYVKRLIKEVMRLQWQLMMAREACAAFLEAWDADPANVVQMEAALDQARRVLDEAIAEAPPCDA